MTIYRLDVSQCESNESAGKLAALASRMTDLFLRLRDAIHNRRSVKQLIDWDDRMLGDIGLTRGDVVSAMSGTVGDDPGRRLSFLASERRRAERATARERLNAFGGYPRRIRRRSGNIVEI